MLPTLSILREDAMAQQRPQNLEPRAEPETYFVKAVVSLMNSPRSASSRARMLCFASASRDTLRLYVLVNFPLSITSRFFGSAVPKLRSPSKVCSKVTPERSTIARKKRRMCLARAAAMMAETCSRPSGAVVRSFGAGRQACWEIKKASAYFVSVGLSEYQALQSGRA
jgi:hypothetical protein